MVKLFASILRVEDERHFLVTPAEKLEIVVEDAPFVAVSMDVFNAGTPKQQLSFSTNLDDAVLVDEKHALSVSHSASDEPSPYVVVRDGLKALLARNVWIELAGIATDRNGVTGVESGGMFFALSN